jgi:hypothetical protein
MKTSETQKVNGHERPSAENAREILNKVHAALKEKAITLLRR